MEQDTGTLSIPRSVLDEHERAELETIQQAEEARLRAEETVRNATARLDYIRRLKSLALQINCGPDAVTTVSGDNALIVHRPNGKTPAKGEPMPPGALRKAIRHTVRERPGQDRPTLVKAVRGMDGITSSEKSATNTVASMAKAGQLVEREGKYYLPETETAGA